MLETLGFYAGAVGLAAASAVVPVINAEIMLAGLVLVVGDVPRAIVLGILVAFGQMLGKSVVYAGMRGTANLGRGTSAGAIGRARALMVRWKDRPHLLMFLSATASIPPYLLVAALAGRVRVRYRTFFAIGLFGRTLRFVTIALIAVAV